MEEYSKISIYLAQNIEKLRNSKNLSQQQLAKLADIPRSTLTNIESGVGNPSLANLVKISSALGVGIEELLSRPRSDCLLIRSEQVIVEERSRQQVQVYKLLPDKIKGIEIDRVEFDVGAILVARPHLRGTKEYLTTIQGEVTVSIAGETYLVKKGDVLAFPGDQPHSYRNSFTATSITISVVIPIPAFI